MEGIFECDWRPNVMFARGQVASCYLLSSNLPVRGSAMDDDILVRTIQVGNMLSVSY